MKTWELYKILDEWNGVSEPKVYMNKNNNTKYIFVNENGRKGLKQANGKLSKAQRHFALDTEWEEQEDSLKVGDWIFYHDGKVNKIIKVYDKQNTHVDAYNCYDNGYYTDGGDYLDKNEDYYRKAMKKEINEELERRKWSRWGRKVNEYRKGDIVLVDNRVGRVTTVEGNALQVSESMYDHLVDNVDMVCPVENRADKQ